MHRQADQLLPAFFRALKVEQPVWLFGHSDGASIALLYAAMFPEQVAGAILLAPHCFVEDLTIVNIAAARAAYLQTDLRQRLAKYHADPDSAFWGWNDIWLNPEFRAWCIDDHLAALDCPLLLVQGSDDEYGTLEQVRRIARQVRQCELLELADCGHSPQRDQKDRLIEAVGSFFQRQGDKP
jgi:pimeloyl-ACP methyl ester carboxylesterase